MLLALLAAISVTVHPAAPTIGDRITLDFAAPVTLDASADYEVLARQGKRVVVRTFRPQPIVLSGTTSGVRFKNLRVPIRSVLRKDDDMKPAPLTPPRPVPMPRGPLAAIAAAAAIAAGVWYALFRIVTTLAPAARAESLPPEDVFRRAVLRLRNAGDAAPWRWAELATATRVYLASTRSQLGSDLTTSEVLPRLGEEQPLVAEILHQGDLEKFSAAGAEPLDFDVLAAAALTLVPVPSPVAEPPR